MADTRDITKDMWYCAQKAFIPENLKKKIDRIKKSKRTESAKKKGREWFPSGYIRDAIFCDRQNKRVLQHLANGFEIL